MINKFECFKRNKYLETENGFLPCKAELAIRELGWKNESKALISPVRYALAGRNLEGNSRGSHQSF